MIDSMSCSSFHLQFMPFTPILGFVCLVVTTGGAYVIVSIAFAAERP